MRFRLIDMAKEEFPVQRMCQTLGVSQSRIGYRSVAGASGMEKDPLSLKAATSAARTGSPPRKNQYKETSIP